MLHPWMPPCTFRHSPILIAASSCAAMACFGGRQSRCPSCWLRGPWWQWACYAAVLGLVGANYSDRWHIYAAVMVVFMGNIYEKTNSLLCCFSNESIVGTTSPPSFHPQVDCTPWHSFIQPTTPNGLVYCYHAIDNHLCLFCQVTDAVYLLSKKLPHT